MPKNVTCVDCEITLLGLVDDGEARPLGRDECPNCGGTAFTEA